MGALRLGCGTVGEREGAPDGTLATHSSAAIHPPRDIARDHRGWPAPSGAVRFTSKASEAAVMLDPELKLGEAYMNGTFVVEEGTIGDVLAIVLGQNNTGLPPRWAQLQWL